MRNYNSIIFTITAFFMVISNNLLAQISDFALTEKNRHLYFEAELAGEPVNIMLESGIPAFLIGRDFYEKTLSKSDIQFEPSTAKIVLLNNKYDISFKGNGNLNVGNAIYNGPIFILDNFDDFRIPVQNFRDKQGNRATIGIDIKNSLFRVGVTTSQEKIGKSYKIRTDASMGFIIVTTPINMHTTESTCQIKGDLIIDFGNPSLLFLMKQHKELAKAINKGKISLKDAYDKDGNLIAQGIYADEITICSNTYNNISIGVSDKMKSIKQLGFLGVPFFDSLTIFDFDKGTMTVYK